LIVGQYLADVIWLDRSLRYYLGHPVDAFTDCPQGILVSPYTGIEKNIQRYKKIKCFAIMMKPKKCLY